MLDNLKKKVQSRKGGEEMSFWFVRHGQSEGNALGDTCPVMHDTPLTETGREEAREIVKYLKEKDVEITDMYSSPQGRSLETAEIIADSLGLEVKTKSKLSERNWGVWRNLRWAEVSKKLDAIPIKERYSFVPEGGESWKQMEQRLIESLEEVADENTEGENILIVMHRGGLRAILPLLAKAGIEKHKEFSVPTGALSKFSFGKDNFDFIGLVPKALILIAAVANGVVHWL